MEPYVVKKIKEDLFALDEGMVRSYLVIGEEKACLVDTGFGAGNIQKLVSMLTDKPVILVNTHADPDHIGGNSYFKEAFIGENEKDYYKMKAKDSGVKLSGLKESEVIDLGGKSLEVVEIPGHTPGSIALLNKSEHYIITGDTVSLATVFLFGEGRSLPEYILSLKKLSRLSSCFKTIYPSHGPLPLEPDIIAELISGAEALLEGKLNEVPIDRPLPTKKYASGRVSFYY